MKVLILYTELAGYMVSCINAAAEDSRISELHVVRYPINDEAPFVFEFHKKVKVYNRKELNRQGLINLAEELKPETVLCSGWIDKDYLKVCKTLRKSSNTVLTMDNHWEGSFKQFILRLLSPFTIHKYFSKTWVPGEPQKEYALKLGFCQDNIYDGFYVTDTEHYSALFKEKMDQGTIPEVFVCVARYIPVKGLELLWDAFIRLKKENNSQWELWCIGHGAGFENKKEYDGIRHLGFIQPNNLEGIMINSGVFVLPSLFEPWGVAVQEFAAAGFPLLLSNKVGSGSSFLLNNENGYLFQSGSVEDLYNALKKITNQSNKENILMSIKSNELATGFSLKKWVDTLVSIGT